MPVSLFKTMETEEDSFEEKARLKILDAKAKARPGEFCPSRLSQSLSFVYTSLTSPQNSITVPGRDIITMANFKLISREIIASESTFTKSHLRNLLKSLKNSTNQ